MSSVQQQRKIGGIDRNTPMSVSEDFSTVELINLRQKEAWRPVGNKPKIIDGLNGCVKDTMFLHKTGETEQLVYMIGDNTIVYADFPGNTTITLDDYLIGKTNVSLRFAAVGNILVMFAEYDVSDIRIKETILLQVD